MSEATSGIGTRGSAGPGYRFAHPGYKLRRHDGRGWNRLDFGHISAERAVAFRL